MLLYIIYYLLIILSFQRPCQEVKVVLCQLSATCIASVGIEGEVGHEVVGYGIADELARHLLNIGNKKVRLGFLLVVHWMVLVLDVFGAVHDGTELAFFYARDVEDDVLCFLRQWVLLPFGIFSSSSKNRSYSSFLSKKKIFSLFSLERGSAAMSLKLALRCISRSFLYSGMSLLMSPQLFMPLRYHSPLYWA